MGSGGYSVHSSRERSIAREKEPISETFKQEKTRKAHQSMMPSCKIIESRDSDEHPNSFPIIIALDVTGSMSRIPVEMIKGGLTTIMSKILKSGVQDPQVLFMAVGDHIYDDYPIQIGQFESSDALLDTWLSRVYLEQGGGPNQGESYFLPWYATKFMELDSLEKRNQKGVLITIGDEPCLESISAFDLKNLFNEEETESMTAKKLLQLAQQKFNVFHVNLANSRILNNWKELLGQHSITTSANDVYNLIAQLCIECSKIQTVTDSGKNNINSTKPIKITL